MTKRNKLLIGLITFLSPAFYVLFVVLFFSSNPEYKGFFSLMNLNVIFIFSILALEVLYYADVLRSNRFTIHKKVLWLLLIFFMHFLIMPIYWYFYMWRTDTKTNANAHLRQWTLYRHDLILKLRATAGLRLPWWEGKSYYIIYFSTSFFLSYHLE